MTDFAESLDNELSESSQGVEINTFTEQNHRSSNLPVVYSKSHSLVMGYMSGSRRQLDLMALMYSQMRDNHWENNQIPTYEFPADKLSAWLKIDSSELSTVLNPVCKALSNKKVGTREYDSHGKLKGFKYTPFFAEIEYKDAVLRIQPNHKLKTNFIEDKKGFALVNSITYLDIEGQHAKRLYEILSRFKDIKSGKLYSIPINELKGMFGLLDENGEVSENKKSFKANKYFMAQCIKKTIVELQTNPYTSKELLFLDGKNGDNGYTAHKEGKRISHIEFHVRWLKNNTFEEISENDEAIDIIRRLEFRRHELISDDEYLDDTELIQLSNAYRSIGKEKKASDLLEDIKRKNKKRAVISHNDEKSLAKEAKDKEKIENLEAQLKDLQQIYGKIDYT
jgi:hypothetical protein